MDLDGFRWIWIDLNGWMDLNGFGWIWMGFDGFEWIWGASGGSREVPGRLGWLEALRRHLGSFMGVTLAWFEINLFFLTIL